MQEFITVESDAHFVSVVDEAGCLQDLIGDRSAMEWAEDFVKRRLTEICMKPTRPALDVSCV